MGEGRTRFIDARDIAESAAGALTTDRFDGQAFTLTGPEALTYGDAAALLSTMLGKPIRYTPLTHGRRLRRARGGRGRRGGLCPLPGAPLSSGAGSLDGGGDRRRGDPHRPQAAVPCDPCGGSRRSVEGVTCHARTATGKNDGELNQLSGNPQPHGVDSVAPCMLLRMACGDSPSHSSGRPWAHHCCVYLRTATLHKGAVWGRRRSTGAPPFFLGI